MLPGIQSKNIVNEQYTANCVTGNNTVGQPESGFTLFNGFHTFLNVFF